MNVHLTKAITVNMPEGPVHLNAGLNTGVADDVAAHWFVLQHVTEPPQPSAEEKAMRLEVEYQTARAVEAEGNLLGYKEQAEYAKQDADRAREELAQVRTELATAQGALSSVQAERDGHAARAVALESKLKQSKSKREQDLEEQIAALTAAATKPADPIQP